MFENQKYRKDDERKVYHLEDKDKRNDWWKFTNKKERSEYWEYQPSYRSQNIRRDQRIWQDTHFQYARINRLIKKQQIEFILNTGKGISIIGELYFDANLKDKVKLINSEETLVYLFFYNWIISLLF